MKGRRLGGDRISLAWYPPALLVVIALLVLPVTGQLPIVVLPLALFLLFFWIFSFGFAIYAKVRKPKDLRQ